MNRKQIARMLADLHAVQNVQEMFGDCCLQVLLKLKEDEKNDKEQAFTFLYEGEMFRVTMERVE
jgi:hypothetical protein